MITPFQKCPVNSSCAKACKKHHGYPTHGFKLWFAVAKTNISVFGKSQRYQENQYNDSEKLHHGTKCICQRMHDLRTNCLPCFWIQRHTNHQSKNDHDADDHQSNFVFFIEFFLFVHTISPLSIRLPLLLLTLVSFHPYNLTAVK